MTAAPLSVNATASFVVPADRVRLDVAGEGAGPETRADVQADLVKAQRSGEYEVNRFSADSYPQLRPYVTHLREGRKPPQPTRFSTPYGTYVRVDCLSSI